MKRSACESIKTTMKVAKNCAWTLADNINESISKALYRNNKAEDSSQYRVFAYGHMENNWPCCPLVKMR